jgi:two-component system alkaline phosphatase synthesis response regulator PhoP
VGGEQSREGRAFFVYSADGSPHLSKRILIADDEPNIVAALEFLLQRNGYEVHIARDGDEALKLVEASQPDLVLLDVMMPVKSGYEVCTRIRERAEWRHIKIIMLSAKGRDAEVNKGLAIGADLYITKPFSTRDLMDRIKGLLDQNTEPGPA